MGRKESSVEEDVIYRAKLRLEEMGSKRPPCQSSTAHYADEYNCYSDRGLSGPRGRQGQNGALYGEYDVYENEYDDFDSTVRQQWSHLNSNPSTGRGKAARSPASHTYADVGADQYGNRATPHGLGGPSPEHDYRYEPVPQPRGKPPERCDRSGCGVQDYQPGGGSCYNSYRGANGNMGATRQQGDKRKPGRSIEQEEDAGALAAKLLEAKVSSSAIDEVVQALMHLSSRVRRREEAGGGQ